MSTEYDYEKMLDTETEIQYRELTYTPPSQNKKLRALRDQFGSVPLKEQSPKKEESDE